MGQDKEIINGVVTEFGNVAPDHFGENHYQKITIKLAPEGGTLTTFIEVDSNRDPKNPVQEGDYVLGSLTGLNLDNKVTGPLSKDEQTLLTYTVVNPS